jgi:hypothetical protein
VLRATAKFLRWDTMWRRWAMCERKSPFDFLLRYTVVSGWEGMIFFRYVLTGCTGIGSMQRLQFR